MEINSKEFNEKFFDARKNKPQKGQAMACYTAIAELVDGADKRFLIQALLTQGQAYAATQVMRKVLLSNEEDSMRIPIEILKDLNSGMLEDEVAEKSYKYTFQMFFYTEPENIPKNDPHWTQITLLNLDSFLENENRVDKGAISAKIVGNDYSKENK